MNKTILFLLFLFLCNFYSRAQDSVLISVYHEFDRPDLTPASSKALEKVIADLESSDIRSIEINAHTDKWGTIEYNQHLSQIRVQYLQTVFQKAWKQHISFQTAYTGKGKLLTQTDIGQERNRRSDIKIYYAGDNRSSVSAITTLDPFFEDVKEQRFTVNLDDSVFINAKQGTQIRFAAGTFTTKNNQPATGNAEILLKEYFTPGDIILSGMHTMSDSGLLQTGGMLKIFVVQNADTISSSNTLKPVRINMPDRKNFAGQMNVYQFSTTDSNNHWTNSGIPFGKTSPSWNWPVNVEKLHDFMPDDLPYERWQTGRKWSNEYEVANNYLLSISKKDAVLLEKPYSRFLRFTIKKIDTVTLAVSLYEKFRRRGVRRFGSRSFDTSFIVKYSVPEFTTELSNFNFINCDRFINAPDITNFYVKTPGFEGSEVMVYFERLNAFMFCNYKNSTYTLTRVPAGEAVQIFAVGKKGDQFYFAKKKTTITKKGRIDLDFQERSYSEIKAEMNAVE